MAITQETLDGLVETGYGPMTLERSGGGHTATMNGKQAAIALEQSTVHVQTNVPVAWPEGGDAAEVDQRVQFALTQVALSRVELITLTGDRSSATVRVSVWIDAEHSNAGDLASAVRSAVLMGEIAYDTVDQVRQNLITEQQLLASTEEARSAVREAEAAVSELSEATEEAARTIPTSDGAQTAPGTRFCTACGTENPSTNKFCSKCGGGLG